MPVHSEQDDCSFACWLAGDLRPVAPLSARLRSERQEIESLRARHSGQLPIPRNRISPIGHKYNQSLKKMQFSFKMLMGRRMGTQNLSVRKSYAGSSPASRTMSVVGIVTNSQFRFESSRLEPFRDRCAR
jgi:hypothetical protein